MLNVGIIGCGNAGCQNAALTNEKLDIDAIAINTSDLDLSTIPEGNITKILIGDSKGSGKDRDATKEMLKPVVKDIVTEPAFKEFMNKDVVFIVSSSGGGSGSMIAVILSDVLKSIYLDTKIVTIGITPTRNEPKGTQLNTIKYLRDIGKIDNITYMLYDNDKVNAGSGSVTLRTVNDAICRDIEVLKGTYQLPTPFDVIDPAESLKLLSAAGRMIVLSVRNIKEKDLAETPIDVSLMNELSTNAHVNTDADNSAERIGVISNLNATINNVFDKNVPCIKELFGEPDAGYLHEVVFEDSKTQNNVFVVISGLELPNGRIKLINERIQEIEENEAAREEKRNRNDELYKIEVTKDDASNVSDKAAVAVNIDDIVNKF